MYIATLSKGIGVVSFPSDSVSFRNLLKRAMGRHRYLVRNKVRRSLKYLGSVGTHIHHLFALVGLSSWWAIN